MKQTLAVMAVVLTLGMTAVVDAQAKRLGGARSSGMQRDAVTAPATAPRATPGTPSQAAPAAAPNAAAAAAASKRSWMGPIAGLAAGLGLAALASYLGFGEALANMLMIGLLVMAVLLAIGFVLRKRAAGQGPSLAGAGAGAGGSNRQPMGMFRTGQAQSPHTGGSLIGSGIGAGLGGVASAQPGAIPADFDAAGFARGAKAQFLALQAANDARDLDRLRDFLTPEMFELVSADIDARGDATQQTEVFGLEAQVLEVAQEDSRYVVSVHFTGSMRDQPGAVPDDLDEIWHLVKPLVGNAGWIIAGIQQRPQGTEAP